MRKVLTVKDGILTLNDTLFQRIYAAGLTDNHASKLQLRHPQGMTDFQFELFPLHSPLLGESLLVSFPPLINMLKFRGYSHLSRDLG